MAAPRRSAGPAIVCRLIGEIGSPIGEEDPFGRWWFRRRLRQTRCSHAAGRNAFDRRFRLVRRALQRVDRGDRRLGSAAVGSQIFELILFTAAPLPDQGSICPSAKKSAAAHGD
jgi:hypothetical protein